MECIWSLVEVIALAACGHVAIIMILYCRSVFDCLLKLLYWLWARCHHNHLGPSTDFLLHDCRIISGSGLIFIIVILQLSCLECTVDSLLTDTPNNGRLPNNGRCSMYQLMSPYIIIQLQHPNSGRTTSEFRITDTGACTHYYRCIQKMIRITDGGWGNNLPRPF